MAERDNSNIYTNSSDKGEAPSENPRVLHDNHYDLKLSARFEQPTGGTRLPDLVTEYNNKTNGKVKNNIPTTPERMLRPVDFEIDPETGNTV
jgi:hypothetical protein